MPIYRRRSRGNPAVVQDGESVFTRSRARGIIAAHFRLHPEEADMVLDKARKQGSYLGPHGSLLIHYDGYNSYRIVDPGDHWQDPSYHPEWDWSSTSYDNPSKKRRKKRKKKKTFSAKLNPRDSLGRFVSPTKKRRKPRKNPKLKGLTQTAPDHWAPRYATEMRDDLDAVSSQFKTAAGKRYASMTRRRAATADVESAFPYSTASEETVPWGPAAPNPKRKKRKSKKARKTTKWW